MMKTKKRTVPLRTVIAGIGGFGSAHQSVFSKLESYGNVQVVATCDPALDRLGDLCDLHDFTRRGVQTFTAFSEMLSVHSGSIDLGVIASPIPFHAAMHEAFVLEQAACYLEKPPTLDPEEFQRMLAIEERAVVATNVGFSYIYLPDRINLKRRMMSGEFGRLKLLSYLGCLSRAPSYFQRNNWAGKLLLNEKLVLDSCVGNAMSHFLNSMLFFGEQQYLEGWARPANMACELYRANPIEGTDTVFALCELSSGVEFRIAASHACTKPHNMSEECMEFEHATITIRSGDHVTIQRSGYPDDVFTIARPSLDGAVSRYVDFLRGSQSRPAQTLMDCKGFVETNALFYLAGQHIHSIPQSALQQAPPGDPVSLTDVEAAARALITHGLLPSQAGFPWAQSGGQSSIEALPTISQIVQTMVSVREKHRSFVDF